VEPKKKEYIMVAHSNGKKVAFITGTNKGIGFETARQLDRRGMAVIIGARDPQRGVDAVATLRGEGIEAHSVRLDVTDEHSIRTSVREVERAFA
jgi:NAD(P)-dependent dehydrogenase (short-subunit alcohol dehydrogenase family)